MKSFLRVNPAVIGFYAFFTMLVHQAGIHIGGFFHFAYIALLILPVFSFIHILLTIAFVRYHQEFENEHPVKGQAIRYRMTISNESLIPSAHIVIDFRIVKPGSSEELPGIQISLGANKRIEKEYLIRCPYRGIYTVGMESLQITDILGWIHIRMPVFQRTFYVFPRVIDIEYPFSPGSLGRISTGSNPGTSQDNSLFESLVQYRPGEGIRHMAWKKYIATGTPFLKRYGKTSQPGLTLYLDLRRYREPDNTILDAEDCTIEIAVAVVKYFLDREIPVAVRALGQSRYEFDASSPATFNHFLKDTLNLHFRDTVSPAELFLADTRGSALTDGAVLFVVHEVDPLVLEILDDAVRNESMYAAIVNRTGMSSADRRRQNELFDALAEKGGRLKTVEDPESIAEDLRA